MKKINIYLIIFSIFLTSCQSIKDGLSGRKSENSDEFLVKKKNPLVMPPKFMELPKPKEENSVEEITGIEETNDIKNILNLEKTSSINSKKSDSAEDFVLKQLKEK
tara:strand:+ start:1267 stop:1584 length:318 start_codon:yes stop_codon:yes gene_type:complete